jgi:eukaryotic-like serine/threonine-protein kinase
MRNSLNAQDWQHVKDVLYHAQQLDPVERQRFLDELSTSDAALRMEIESLLQADAQSCDILQRRSSAASETPAETGVSGAHGVLRPGAFFEQRFKLVRALGEGGMGQVWLAEQVSPVRRQVAIKLIKAGLYDAAVAQRFAAERQSLALMQHPAIAKVFEAGTTAQDQPYLVMEYVSGSPITKYCDSNALGIVDRIELLIQTCEAVQHAHQKAILHRDLKPANILVTQVDGKCTPRIIDFGLAKPTTPISLTESPLTEFGQFVGTPGYISPEQTNFSGQDIDTRADVYALGAVLYVLLVGMRPFDIAPGQSLPADAWLKKLREEDPVRPSAKLAALGDAASVVCASRQIQPKHLIAVLRGDLDSITTKALERDRARRYGTPAELAADLRRYLDHEPVTARTASVGYRANRYVRRHRVGVAVSILLLLILVAFSAWQTVNVQRLARERVRVMRERDRAVQATDFLGSVFTLPTQDAQGDSVTARELLERSGDELLRRRTQDPDARSQMLHLLARAYSSLGLYKQAEGVAQAAYESRRKLHGPDDERTLESMAQLGWIEDHAGAGAKAEALEREALVRARLAFGADNALTLEILHKLSTVVADEGRSKESEDLLREWREAMRRKRDSGESM